MHTHTHTQHIYKCSGPIIHTHHSQLCFAHCAHIVIHHQIPQLSNTSISVYPFIHVRISYEHHHYRAILDCPTDLVCSSHPTHINVNCTFVVDTSKLRDSNDIKCDDCGVWKQTKTVTTDLKLTFDEDRTV